MSRAIVETQNRIYKPTFDSDTNSYIDVCPCKKHDGSYIKPVYFCRCKYGATFKNVTQFNAHVKTNVHQAFLTGYEGFYRESDESQEIIRELRIENERQRREIQRLHRELVPYKHIKEIFEKEVDRSGEEYHVHVNI
jgi:hypothetical protein